MHSNVKADTFFKNSKDDKIISLKGLVQYEWKAFNKKMGGIKL